MLQVGISLGIHIRREAFQLMNPGMVGVRMGVAARFPESAHLRRPSSAFCWEILLSMNVVHYIRLNDSTRTVVQLDTRHSAGHRHLRVPFYLNSGTHPGNMLHRDQHPTSLPRVYALCFRAAESTTLLLIRSIKSGLAPARKVRVYSIMCRLATVCPAYLVLSSMMH